MSNHVTITGRLGADPEIRFTTSGQALCNVRIVDQERRKNDQTGQWEDAGEPLWMGGTIWGPKGEAFGNVARKGDLITLTGRLQARSWEQDGTKRTVTEIKVFEAAVVPKAEAKGGSWGVPAQSGGQWSQAPASDPWGQAPAQTKQTGGAGNGYDEPPF